MPTASEQKEDLRQKASEMGQQARQGARESYEQIRQYTNESLEKARQQWNESRGRLGERAQGVVQEQKQRLCAGIDGIAQAARAAAERLEEREDQSVAGYARAAAGSLEQVRDYLQAADVRDMADDVRQFTRRHPEWVLGGLFVAGLAMARFMKADRPIEPRGLPEGADESLYRDVYRSQRGEDRDFGMTGDDYGDFDDAGTGFSSYYEAGSTGSARDHRPGESGGYNPSGGQDGGSAYQQQSFGQTVAGNTATDRGNDEQKGATI
jgi:hypothetical protein